MDSGPFTCLFVHLTDEGLYRQKGPGKWLLGQITVRGPRTGPLIPQPCPAASQGVPVGLPGYPREMVPCQIHVGLRAEGGVASRLRCWLLPCPWLSPKALCLCSTVQPWPALCLACGRHSTFVNHIDRFCTPGRAQGHVSSLRILRIHQIIPITMKTWK